jgi:hypothetical protein
MPKALERKLKRQAKKKGLGKKRTGAYVYGTMMNMGWVPSTHKKKGKKRGGKKK